MNLREVEYKFRIGDGVFEQLWKIEIELEWHMMGVVRNVKGYIEKDGEEWQKYLMNNSDNNIEIENIVLESARKAEREDKTVIWPRNDELVKVANKTLESIKNKYFFRRCKKNIGGSVLRKHGISWVRVGNGIFVPTMDGEKYPIDKIAGVLFEHQYPHLFSLP